MDNIRAAGVLLHPTSLPSPDGIGDLGPEAYRWLDFLAKTGCQMWQILPLGPTGYGDSPYQCFSAFAGNPYLVSPVLLLDEGMISKEDLEDRPDFPDEHVDFGPVITWKKLILDRAFNRFTKTRRKKLHEEFLAFQEAHKEWLLDFAIFMAIKEAHGNYSWEQWPDALRKRNPKALKEFNDSHEKDIERQMFRQFLFFRQWQALKNYAVKSGIQIIGDIPFVIAYDSADVWSNPDLFFLDKNSLPTVVAGVPPDYFSRTGQLWGNPLYRWENHKKNDYQWWLQRIQAVLTMVDIVRLDHFRGFEANWEVPYGNPTAEVGRWVKGPGHDFFKTVEQKLGHLPIIAEDLGLITDGVIDIRDSYNLPGMKILQFAFASDPDDDFLPHNYPVNCYAYTGTHDNNTSQGWYLAAGNREKDFCRRYLTTSGDNIAWALIRSLWQSVASKVVAPMQDLLSLDSWARMNMPGAPSGNWSWRMLPNILNDDLVNHLYEINYLFGRLPKSEKDKIRQSLDAALAGEVKPH